MLNLADIAGANAAVQLSATNITCRSVYFAVTGSGTVRLGAAGVSNALGLPLLAASPFQMSWAGDNFGYSLAQLYAYVPTGTTLSVAYEPFN